jgi:guanyl-specific ribonuclease Sa
VSGRRPGAAGGRAGGYYREFTVETPGLGHRGARRIVTGGEIEQDPEHWYYTQDHYQSFCEFETG